MQVEIASLMAAHAAENAAAHIKAAAEEAVQGGKIAAADVDKIVRIWNLKICSLLIFLS